MKHYTEEREEGNKKIGELLHNAYFLHHCGNGGTRSAADESGRA